MKKQLIALMFALLPGFALAAGPSVHLDKANIDLSDKAALQDGARTFVNYCMGCHSAQYQRYERVATDLGIPEELMMENLVFTDALYGDHMKIGMRPEDSKVWFGAAPPDLTMVARVRGEDWLYTYLRSFYEDRSRPFGWNNTVFENVGMPHVLAELQGKQIKGCAPVPVKENGKVVRDSLTGEPMLAEQCDVLTVVEGTGTQTADEYDTTVRNLVAFLSYSADPIKETRHRIGVYVLLYLAFFFVFAYLLKREYWKDIK
ncbi:cytochrome c1 [Halopseudomonas formosensis]|uniref:Cytochrome c1 n=1 Tax=Halopseudomonas formosensis TaxID=1002526 RepID=A0ABU5BTR8_9GAMM|nr:cytochrome c1 [Halopseudomonas formosensis]MDX9686066.1 cytochrome c1 [Halopseudomonas formosensis]